ncbi:MAG: AraC family transcriptional regulator [Xanthobacteraceae bacterium]
MGLPALFPLEAGAAVCQIASNYDPVFGYKSCARIYSDDERSRALTNSIALDCGFSGSSQFSVVFKRVVGVSPRQYRRTL